jgi:hypothetical protein
VANGAFAAGHVGELTQQIPFEMVDEALAETGAVQQRIPVQRRTLEGTTTMTASGGQDLRPWTP